MSGAAGMPFETDRDPGDEDLSPRGETTSEGETQELSNVLDRAVRILWDWTHEDEPGPMNPDRAMAIGVLTGEAYKSRFSASPAPQDGEALRDELVKMLGPQWRKRVEALRDAQADAKKLHAALASRPEGAARCSGGPWINGGDDEHGPVDLCSRCGLGREMHTEGAAQPDHNNVEAEGDAPAQNNCQQCDHPPSTHECRCCGLRIFYAFEGATE